MAIAFILALIRRRMACPEPTSVANLALAPGGVGLVVRSLPAGRPPLLLVSFILHGAALLLIPRACLHATGTRPRAGASRASMGTRS